MAFKVLYLRVTPLYSSMSRYNLHSVQLVQLVQLYFSSPAQFSSVWEMRKVYSSDIVQLEKEVTQINVINVLYSKHCAHSPHEVATSSMLQQANANAFEFKKIALLTGEAMRQNLPLHRNYL